MVIDLENNLSYSPVMNYESGAEVNFEREREKSKLKGVFKHLSINIF